MKHDPWAALTAEQRATLRALITPIAQRMAPDVGATVADMIEGIEELLAGGYAVLVAIPDTDPPVVELVLSDRGPFETVH